MLGWGGRMKRDLLVAGRSVNRILAAVIAAGCLGWWASPASAFQGPGSSQLRDAAARANASLLHNVIVVCRVYTTGNTRHTRYCENGYVCAPNDKCAPGPAMLREIERKRDEEARREAEEQRRREIEQARQAEQARQRAAAARQAELVRQLAQRHANTPNPFGAASADCNSTITDKDHPGGPRANCNTGGTVNGPTGPAQHPTRQPVQQTQAPRLQIPGFTLTIPGNSTGASTNPQAQQVETQQVPTQQQVQTQPVATANPPNNPSSNANNPQRPDSSAEDEERRKREAQRRASCAALISFTNDCEELAKRMGRPGQPNAVGSAEIDAGTGAFRACSLATCKIANEKCSDYPGVVRQTCKGFPEAGTCKIEAGFHLFFRDDKGEFECQPNRPSYAEPAGNVKP
jgi:hypothetical protein